MRRQLIIKICNQQEKLTTTKNKLKKRKCTKQTPLIIKQLHNLEILTSQYDEILLNGTRKADANSRHTPLQIMNLIWEANQLAGYVLDYEKYDEFTQVPAIKTDKHPLNEEILTTWTHQDRISTLNAHPQIADNTSKALLNPKSTPKGLVAMQKKRKFKGNSNRNNKRHKSGNKNGGKPFRNNNNNRNHRNTYNGNRQNGTKTMKEIKQTQKEEQIISGQIRGTTTLFLSAQSTIGWQKNAHHIAKTTRNMIKLNIKPQKVEPKTKNDHRKPHQNQNKTGKNTNISTRNIIPK